MKRIYNQEKEEQVTPTFSFSPEAIFRFREEATRWLSQTRQYEERLIIDSRWLSSYPRVTSRPGDYNGNGSAGNTQRNTQSF